MITDGASSLHHALENWRNIKERVRLSKQVITESGYNLEPEAKDNSKSVHDRIMYIPHT